MLYELPNGKTIDIPLEIFFQDDVKFNYYIEMAMSENLGFVTENFFHDGNNMKNIEEDEGFIDDDLLLQRDDI